MVDEPAARSAAQRAGLRVIGVVGVLLAARQAGYVPSVRPLLDQLLAAGMRLSQGLYDQAVREAGEAG
ncbi:MAG: DUF3368 domain-containing protein [Armatimonadetes bacterium]|nr:DUF3368 domain-containing protein [Armatimonadota bacterium]